MYSGTTIRTKSGRIMGVHQRIDRLARRNLSNRVSDMKAFPTIKDILHFEGRNGPDGIKRKSPSIDEPWHHINPDDPSDRALIGLIDDHIYNLSVALRNGNNERASFEAAWLAHAVVDGLTPAHHDNLGDKIEELWGKAHHERDSVLDKVLIRGNSGFDTLKKNWQYWGGKGVFTAHIMFEWGVATALTSVKFPSSTGVSANDMIRLEQQGFEELFYESLRTVSTLNMYQSFGEKGWTRELATLTKAKLIPEIVKAVTLAWYQAILLSRGAGNARTNN